MFYEVSIQAAPSGFGEYQCQPINGEGWADESDLLTECQQGATGDVYELGVDELPEGVDDISGRVHSEPERVFAVVGDDGAVSYFGITSREA